MRSRWFLASAAALFVACSGGPAAPSPSAPASVAGEPSIAPSAPAAPTRAATPARAPATGVYVRNGSGDPFVIRLRGGLVRTHEVPPNGSGALADPAAMGRATGPVRIDVLTQGCDRVERVSLGDADLAVIRITRRGGVRVQTGASAGGSLPANPIPPTERCR